MVSLRGLNSAGKKGRFLWRAAKNTREKKETFAEGAKAVGSFLIEKDSGKNGGTGAWERRDPIENLKEKERSWKGGGRGKSFEGGKISLKSFSYMRLAPHGKDFPWGGEVAESNMRKGRKKGRHMDAGNKPWPSQRVTKTTGKELEKDGSLKDRPSITDWGS